MVDAERLGTNLSEDLSRKVVMHRDEYYHFFINRFLEMLATLYKYNIKNFDAPQVEVALRQGYGICFGKNKLGQDVVLGYVPFQDNNIRPFTMFRRRYTGRDVTYTIPKSLIPEGGKTTSFREIWDKDNASSGSFVVISNKQLNLTSDYDIIRYYASELAEIVASRYSLIIQSKIMTVLTGEVGDETMNQMIASIYNGNPFVKTAKSFDVDDSIIQIQNTDLANNLTTLKDEYQIKLAELNSMFGINMLAVTKQSGVTESEGRGNLSYVTANSNIWLESRQKALSLYNNRFGCDYQVYMDNETQVIQGDKNLDEDNNDNSGDTSSQSIQNRAQ